MIPMQKLSGVFAILATTAAPVGAGVVITQVDVSPDGAGGTRTITTTISIEGSKQRIEGADGVVQIVDAEAGTMTTLNPATKTALQMSMDGMGEMMSGIMASAQFEMKATGERRTIAGHACEDYQGSGKVMMAESSVLQCLSKTAPGAAEYAAFGKKMMGRMNVKMPAGHPEGLVLFSETTTRTNFGGGLPGMPKGMPPNLPPEIAEQIAKAQANAAKPQLTRSEVKSVKVQAVPAASFVIPADYKKEDMGAFMKRMQGGGE